MKIRRVVSKKTGRVGHRARYTDRQTGQRFQKTVWIAERADAETAFRTIQSRSGKREHNIADTAGWKLPYAELIKRFVDECTVSPARRKKLSKLLAQNPLKLAVAGELCSRGVLNIKCKSLAASEEIRIRARRDSRDF